jgi:hypothetical protein
VVAVPVRVVPVPEALAGGELAAWASRAVPRRTVVVPADGLRFAFYGRVSTEDHQDPESSRGWQVTRAQALVAGAGRIVREFFDVGYTRVLPWTRRPGAAALVAALSDPHRDFDAIVIGEAERAFYGQQYAAMAPVFARYGVQVWVPEVGGVVREEVGGAEELMVLLGIMSKREILRAKARTVSAMTALTRGEGRYLGGRAPTATVWSAWVRTRTRPTPAGAGSWSGWRRIR